MTSEFGDVAARSNKSRSLGCKPSPREAAIALNLSKDLISKAPVLVPRRISMNRSSLTATPTLALKSGLSGGRIEFEAKKRSVDTPSMRYEPRKGHAR
jgi:hypothetical protein